MLEIEQKLIEKNQLEFGLQNNHILRFGRKIQALND